MRGFLHQPLGGENHTEWGMWDREATAGPGLGRGPDGHPSEPKPGLPRSFFHFPQMLPSNVKSLLREGKPPGWGFASPLSSEGSLPLSLGSPLCSFPSLSSRPSFLMSVVSRLSASGSPGAPDQYRSPSPQAQSFLSVGPGGTQDLAFLTSPQVLLLLVQRTHVES